MVFGKRKFDLERLDRDVKEVVDFACSDRPVDALLSDAKRPDANRFHVISSVGLVWTFGFSDPGTLNSHEQNGGSHWRSAVSEEIAPIYGQSPDERNAGDMVGLVEDVIDQSWSALTRLLDDSITIQHDILTAGDLCEEALASLTHIAAWRATMGEDSPFIADMWNAFQTGGWPFGWFGEYPEGKMVVWKPEL